MVLFTNEYFPTSLLFSAPNFPIMIDPAQIVWPLQSITYDLPCPFFPVHFEESTYASYLSTLCKVSQLKKFFGCANLAASFCTGLEHLSLPPYKDPNKTTHIQELVELVTCRLSL
jgi:hypothetical protein